jgi:uncharacterized protein (DUF983 family)
MFEHFKCTGAFQDFCGHAYNFSTSDDGTVAFAALFVAQQIREKKVATLSHFSSSLTPD